MFEFIKTLKLNEPPKDSSRFLPYYSYSGVCSNEEDSFNSSQKTEFIPQTSIQSNSYLSSFGRVKYLAAKYESKIIQKEDSRDSGYNRNIGCYNSFIQLKEKIDEKMKNNNNTKKTLVSTNIKENAKEIYNLLKGMITDIKNGKSLLINFNANIKE